MIVHKGHQKTNNNISYLLISNKKELNNILTSPRGRGFEVQVKSKERKQIESNINHYAIVNIHRNT